MTTNSITQRLTTNSANHPQLAQEENNSRTRLAASIDHYNTHIDEHNEKEQEELLQESISDYLMALDKLLNP